jgi:hypothetical protein
LSQGRTKPEGILEETFTRFGWNLFAVEALELNRLQLSLYFIFVYLINKVLDNFFILFLGKTASGIHNGTSRL